MPGVRIIDFGCGCFLHNGMYQQFSGELFLFILALFVQHWLLKLRPSLFPSYIFIDMSLLYAWSVSGTSHYIPPEWYLHGSYRAEPMTVWQVGVLAYRMLVGKHPFSTKEDITSKEPCFGSGLLPGRTLKLKQALVQTYNKLPRFSLQTARNLCGAAWPSNLRNVWPWIACWTTPGCRKADWWTWGYRCGLSSMLHCQSPGVSKATVLGFCVFSAQCNIVYLLNTFI